MIVNGNSLKNSDQVKLSLGVKQIPSIGTKLLRSFIWTVFSYPDTDKVSPWTPEAFHKSPEWKDWGRL